VRSLLAPSGAMIASTWTEDRATLGSDPSADPGAHTEGRGACTEPRFLAPLRDEHQCDKPNVAAHATAYLSTNSVAFTPNQHKW
jgi:hypothetical protein